MSADSRSTGRLAAVGALLARLLRPLGISRRPQPLAEQRLMALLRAIPVAVMILDRKGHLQFWNAAAERIFGWTSAEVLGRPLPTIPPDKREEFLEHIAATRAGQTLHGVETRRQRKNGEPVFVSLSSAILYGPDGAPSELLAIVDDITHRHRADAALRRSEERLRLAVEAGRMGNWEWDVASGGVTWSASLERVHGLEPGSFPGTFDAVEREVHPDDRARFMHIVRTAAEAGTDYRLEYRIVRRDGVIVWLEAHGKVVRDASGRTVRMVGVCRDISDRKREEEDRARLLARASFLERASDILASSLDIERTLERVARLAVEDLAEWSAVDLVQEDGSIRRVTGAHRDPTRDVMARTREARCHLDPEAPHGVPHVLRTGQAELYTELPPWWFEQTAHDETDRAHLRDLHYTSALIVPLVIRGRARGALTLLRAGEEGRYRRDDLLLAEELARRAALAVDNAWLYEETARRRQEAEGLADVARLLSQSLDLPAVSQQIVDALRGLLHAEAAGLHLEEAPSADVRTIAVSGALHTWGLNRVYPRGTGLLGLALAEGRTVMTTDFRTDGRLTYPPEIRERLERADFRALLAVPFTAPDGGRGVLVVGDRTGRRFGHADVRLAQAFATQAAIALENARLYQKTTEANRAKDEFLATLSHELRTPLQSMLGWITLLRAGALDPPAAARAMETIERNTRAQAQLIEDLLDVSRIVAGQLRLDLRPVNLVAVVEAGLESMRATASAKGVALATAVDPRAAEVAGDPARLQQILWNLLSNAVKFTPAGGRVDVRLEHLHGAARLSVQDNGRGIAPDLLPHIFERFHQGDSSTTRTHGGLGLGLAIVRHLVELHGGRVTATSGGAAQGATFTVDLPLAEPATPCVALPPGLPGFDDRLDGIRVLVVDDNPETLELVSTVLERHGAELATAADVEHALAAFEHSPPHVLVCDLSMPGRDGYSLLTEISARQVVPAVALTAHARAEDRARALAAGFQRYLAKPVEPMDLVRAVASLVGRSIS